MTSLTTSCLRALSPGLRTWGLSATLGNLDEAQEYGESALAMAEEHGYDFFRRNCYYLLGEIASQSGEDAKADDYFRRLAEFYPQFAFLSDFLREYDISSMINLKEFA